MQCEYNPLIIMSVVYSEDLKVEIWNCTSDT